MEDLKETGDGREAGSHFAHGRKKEEASIEKAEEGNEKKAVTVLRSGGAAGEGGEDFLPGLCQKLGMDEPSLLPVVEHHLLLR